jgi:hypothetical protein
LSITFTKLFSSITASTVWCEDPETKVVWITMLAMSDRLGRVSGSIPGLAAMARVSVDATRRALDKFLSPDPDSRSKEVEGRRIEVIDGGWRLINYKKYREMRDEEERKQYKAEWARESRQKRRQSGQSVDTVDRDRPLYTNAEADAEADAYKNSEKRVRAERSTRIPPDFGMTDERRGYAEKQGVSPIATMEAFVDYWTAVSGAKARKNDWDATWRTWCRRQEKTPMGQKTAWKAIPASEDSLEWREAKSRGEAIGFRKPWPLESVGAYMTQVKLEETRKPAKLDVSRVLKRIPA